MGFQNIAQMDVLINIKAVVGEGIKKINNATKAMTNMANSQKKLVKQGLSQVKSNKGVNAGLGAMNWLMGKSHLQMKRFRMDLLSLMFYFQGLQRAFTSLINPALEAAGVFDIMGAFLKSEFIETGIDVNGMLMDMWSNFDNIADSAEKNGLPLRRLMGSFFVVGMVVSMALVSLFALNLMLSSTFNVTLASIIPKITDMGTAFATTGITIAGVSFTGGLAMAVLAGVVMVALFVIASALYNIEGIFESFGEFFDEIWSGIGNSMNAWGEFIASTSEFFGNIFAGNWTAAINGLADVFIKFALFLETIWTNAIGNVIGFVIDLFFNLVEGAIGVLSQLQDFFGLEIFDVNKARANARNMGNAIAEGIRRPVSAALSFGAVVSGNASLNDVYANPSDVPFSQDSYAGLGKIDPSSVYSGNKYDSTMNLNVNVDGNVMGDQGIDMLTSQITNSIIDTMSVDQNRFNKDIIGGIQ